MNIAPEKLTTARGRLEVSEGDTVRVDELGLQTNIIVMEESPSVLSLGRRCMTRGYSFRLDAEEPPKIILPNGGSCELEVDHCAPLLAAALDIQ